MTLGEANISANLDTEKDGEFRCESCRARCSRSPTEEVEYGHHTGCPQRPDEFPSGGKYLKNCDHAPGQQVATDGGNSGVRETHLGDAGLFVPADIRNFERQIVFRTPRTTVQHFDSGSLDGYYGMVTEDDFGPAEEFRDPKNPDLAPNRVRIKPQGEDPIEFIVDLDPDLRCDGGIGCSYSSSDQTDNSVKCYPDPHDPGEHHLPIRGLNLRPRSLTSDRIDLFFEPGDLLWPNRVYAAKYEEEDSKCGVHITASLSIIIGLLKSFTKSVLARKSDAHCSLLSRKLRTPEAIETTTDSGATDE